MLDNLYCLFTLVELTRQAYTEDKLDIYGVQGLSLDLHTPPIFVAVPVESAALDVLVELPDEEIMALADFISNFEGESRPFPQANATECRGLVANKISAMALHHPETSNRYFSRKRLAESMNRTAYQN